MSVDCCVITIISINFVENNTFCIVHVFHSFSCRQSIFLLTLLILLRNGTKEFWLQPVTSKCYCVYCGFLSIFDTQLRILLFAEKTEENSVLALKISCLCKSLNKSPPWLENCLKLTLGYCRCLCNRCPS